MTNGSKKRLGGWTRLWLVFSAVWVVGCSVFFFNTAPERESVELSAEEADQYRVDQIVQAMQSSVGVTGIPPVIWQSPIFQRGLTESYFREEKFRAELRERGVSEDEIERQWRTKVDKEDNSILSYNLEDEVALIAFAERLKEDYEENSIDDDPFWQLEPSPAMQEALEQKRRSVTSSHLFRFLSFALLVPMVLFGVGWTMRWVWDGFVKKDA